jgi:hypothetical protein
MGRDRVGLFAAGRLHANRDAPAAARPIPGPTSQPVAAARTRRAPDPPIGATAGTGSSMR